MLKDTLRILYITTFYPSLDRPHHGIFFRDHAEALAKNYSTAVLNCSVLSLKEKRIRFQKDGLFLKNDVFTLFQSSTTLSHRFKKFNSKKLETVAIRGLKQLENDWGKPDLIIAQCSLPAGELALKISDQKRIPFGIIEHFSFLSEQIKHEKNRMAPIYNKAAFLCSVNSRLKVLMEENFKKNVIKIDNVISSEFSLRSNNLNPSPFRWLHIGYDDPKKGADLIRGLLDLRPNLHLTVVGSGLEKYIKVSNTNVRYIPTAKRDEIIKLMHQHHAFLSVSRTETFGMAIVESLATGMPAVVTKSGGPESYFSNDYGFICNQNAEEINTSMLKLEEQYAQFDSSKISSSILSKFGAANYIAQLEQIIQIVL